MERTNVRWKTRNTISTGRTTIVMAAKTLTEPAPWVVCNVTRPSGNVVFSSLVMKMSGPK
jgi:hypothetical protein